MTEKVERDGRGGEGEGEREREREKHYVALLMVEKTPLNGSPHLGQRGLSPLPP